MKNISKRLKRIIASLMAIIMAVGMVQVNTEKVDAATTATAGVSSLGSYGSINIGSKTKSATWWKLSVGSKTAFCLDLGYTCHSGNKYEAKESFNWNQNTGGEKRGYYAKIIRWYVNDCNRSKKSYLFSQALIWSVAEGRNSESQLKQVIKDMKSITGYFDSKTANQLYEQIFEPDGAWTASATYWEKTGNAKSYQTLITVDAESVPDYKTLNKSDYYRQRITIMKEDEFGKGLGGIQFTLKASNLDDLYSFYMLDANGTESDKADEDNDTSFEMTGKTRDSGRIAWRMTYKIYASEKVYYTDNQLSKMNESEFKAAKAALKDEGYKEGKDFGASLTKDEAEDLAKEEIYKEFDKISNTYTLTEDNVGSNTHIFIDPNFAKGKKITLKKDNSWFRNSDGSWPDTKAEIQSDFALAYKTGVVNKFKKTAVKVKKVDADTGDSIPLGDAELDGAQFSLYEDEACTQTARVFDKNGQVKGAAVYQVKDGYFITDYLIPNKTYYLKELKAPTGYTLGTAVIPIRVNGANVPELEYNQIDNNILFREKVYKGDLEIQKEYVDDEYEIRGKEKGATFQVYLANKESYDKCIDGLERATIVTDENGYGKATGLVYGKYIVHQVDSGEIDAYTVKDFEVTVDEDGKVYTYKLENQMFKAYLKILKKSKNTEKMILKSGTTYQIYKVDEDGRETLVTQKYKNANGEEVKVDKFTTDDTGEITTVQPLLSATYHLYEVEAADGFHISDQYIEVVINSKSSQYDSYVDEDGYTHVTITVEYFNEETYGKLSIKKTGDELTAWDPEKKEFVYTEKSLKGAVFEIYADGDIVTQDNQGTKWFDDKELVATITTGEKAEFAKECKGITGYTMDEDGTIHINLPLGKYKVKEVKTLYGYVFPDKHEWDVMFNWTNSTDEFVLNSTEDTDEKGILNVKNEFAKPSLEVTKQDGESKEAVEGAEFGLYTKDAIYNASGEKILDAGSLLYTLTTNKEGKIVFDKKMPLMDKAFSNSSTEKENGEDFISEETLSTLNTGDYYIKELSISDSYYLDDAEIPIHLEYKDADTKIIEVQSVKENTQTTNEIDKVNAAGSKEVDGCHLEITDKDGNKIISWTSGDKDSVKVYVSEEDGYRNLKYNFDETGNLHVGGLFHDVDYVLTETRPADGYVTADSITYQIREVRTSSTSADADSVSGSAVTENNTAETTKSVVAIKQKDGSYKSREDNKTIMHDEETHIRFIKVDSDSGEGLSGAKIKVTDKDGKEVMTFVSKDDGVDITGKLAVGQTYTFTEISAPSGYKIADPVKLKIEDTSEIQKVTMKDEKIPDVPHVPQTGKNLPMSPMGAACLVIAGLIGFVFRRKWIIR